MEINTEPPTQNDEKGDVSENLEVDEDWNNVNDKIFDNIDDVVPFVTFSETATKSTKRSKKTTEKEKYILKPKNNPTK